MDEIDLDQPASLWWTATPLELMKNGVVYPGDNRQFGSVRNAVRFCMEKLDPSVRQSARIDLDSGPSLSADTIAALYDEIQDA